MIILTDNLPKVLRVDTFTNFNYTDKEFAQLDKIQCEHPEYKIFVNSNSHVELRGDYPAIVCINPGIDTFIPPRGKLDIIKAVRIKYVANPTDKVRAAFNDAVTWAYAHNVPILITYMRFRSTETLKRYTRDGSHYKWQKNYYRQLARKTFDLAQFHYCDLNEQGCPSCMNCAKLTFGISDAKLLSTNLSSSGSCKFNCPDCFVNTFLKCRTNIGHIAFDKIASNIKQQGHDRYIKGFGKDRTLTFDEFLIKENGQDVDKLVVDELDLGEDIYG